VCNGIGIPAWCKLTLAMSLTGLALLKLSHHDQHVAIRYKHYNNTYKDNLYTCPSYVTICFIREAGRGEGHFWYGLGTYRDYNFTRELMVCDIKGLRHFGLIDNP
jgi:hypothetical protein